MAHYAFLDENNVVTEVITGIDEAETIEGLDTETWYGNFRGQTCKRTSYNTIGGQNLQNGTPFRYNYAGIGYRFDPDLGTHGAFIPPQPYPSWTLNTQTALWDAPIPQPNYLCQWDEETMQWVNL